MSESVIAVADRPQTSPSEMSYSEFLEAAHNNPHVEWVEGKVVPMSPVSKVLNDLSLFVLALMRHYTEAHDLGIVLCDPFQIKTGAELPGRAPDVLFLAKEHQERLRTNFLEGPADLVVEIISPSSRTVDRGEKFYEYEQGDVPELWMLEPARRQADFYQLGNDHLYHFTPIDRDGIYHSRILPGLWLRVAWFWQSPLPPLLTVLREWKLI